MKKNCFDLHAYLKRIHYDGKIDVTVDTLAALHHAQLHTIPFENFDILLDRGIDLEPGAIFNKLVLKKRGGYCFELNGLFLMALKTVGFHARALLARVHRSGTTTGRGHQILMVTLEGRRWITDVGFGKDTLRAPIPLELNKIAVQDGQKTRLVNAGQLGTILQHFEDGEWMDLYSFDLSRVYSADIVYSNHYASTHPDSMFTIARFAARPVNNGVVTLINQKMTKTVRGENTITELPEGQAYLDALLTHFGIDLEVPYEELRSLPEEETVSLIGSK